MSPPLRVSDKHTRANFATGCNALALLAACCLWFLMPVTLKEVAELAGVSRSAVSRTFTEGASVSEKTRRKVEKAADALGYRPNALASSLTTGRTKLIGLVVSNFRNPFFMEVFDLFPRARQARG